MNPENSPLCVAVLEQLMQFVSILIMHCKQKVFSPESCKQAQAKHNIVHICNMIKLVISVDCS